jgi:hypothetical protein
MTITCPECSIRYAADLPACPWCGTVAVSAPVPVHPEEDHAPQAQAGEAPIGEDEDHAGEPQVEAPAAPSTAAAATHTETRAKPPTPTQSPSRSVTYDLTNIPGPDEEWEPIDEWLDEEPHDAGGAVMVPADRVKRWAVTGLGVVALLAFGAFLAEVLPVGIGAGGNDPAPTVAVAPTTAPVVTSAPEPTVTTAPPAPTTTAPPPAATIEPIGDPAADLRLSEDGLGELSFGADGIDVVGRLVATFGQPDLDTGPRPAPAAEAGGFCEGEQQRQVRWGSLSIYNRVAADGEQTLGSVQINLADGDDPADGVATLSGLAVGDTIADLQSIYDGFGVELFPDTGGGLWEVRAASDGRLLLWGTMSGDEPNDVITSIRSSLRCG